MQVASCEYRPEMLLNILSTQDSPSQQKIIAAAMSIELRLRHTGLEDGYLWQHYRGWFGEWEVREKVMGTGRPDKKF